ncbi:MAG: SprT-like domain-containing protein [Eubacteriales bacterium]
MNEIINLMQKSKNILQKRSEVSRLLMQSSPNINCGDIDTISTADLHLLFQLYDQIFLDNWFKTNFRGKFKFSLSRRMTRSAGQTRCPKNIGQIKPEQLTIEICIGVDFFFQYNLVEGNKAVGGITTANSLEALQLVFEHELCHAIEHICFGKSNCSADRFKSIAGNLFGHTGEFHSLPTNRQIASQKMGLKPGDTVSFSFKGNKLHGILYRINKRAIVMVNYKQGQFADKQGNRYLKYYVPLNILEKQ